MKKLLLAAMLLFASYGVFADEFDTFVEGIKSQDKQNEMVVRADKPHRMVFIDFKLPDEVVSLTNEQVAEAKAEMLKVLISDKEAAPIIRDLNVTIVTNFITKGGKIYSVVISSGDL